MDPGLIKRLAPLVTSLEIPVVISTHSREEQALLGGRLLELDKLMASEDAQLLKGSDPV